jgi:hypothetical protein
MRRWSTWEGAWRAAGEGPLGLHYGSHVWTLEAVRARRAALANFIPKTWIENFSDGSWKRVGNIFYIENL